MIEVIKNEYGKLELTIFGSKGSVEIFPFNDGCHILMTLSEDLKLAE